MSTDFQTEKLRRRCECGQPIFHSGAHLFPIHRKPVWIERKESLGLPAKDYTRSGPDAA